MGWLADWPKMTEPEALKGAAQRLYMAGWSQLNCLPSGSDSGNPSDYAE
jgi:hypothetical protein